MDENFLEKFCHNNFKVLILLILFFSLFLRIFWGYEKQGLHIDEVLSLTIANHNQLGISLLDNKIYEKNDLQEKLFFNNSSSTDAIKDISNLYFDNKDLPHTNLYYSLLRLSFLGRSVYSLSNIIYTGIILNILFFIVCFIFLYKLLSLLFVDNYLILITLFCSSVAGSTISTSMFLRPYQLQSAMLIIFTYVSLKIFVDKLYNQKMFLALSFSVAGVLLAGYFSLVYVGLAFLPLGVYFLKNKDFKKILYYGFGYLVGFILVQVLYLKYWQTIFNGSDRAGEAYQKISLDYVLNNVLNSAIIVHNFLSSYLLYGLDIFVIVVTSYLFYVVLVKKQKIAINYLAFYVIISCLIFSVVVITLAPLKVMRYIMPVFPLVSLIIPFSLAVINNKNFKNVIVIVLVPIFLINSFNLNKINFLYTNKTSEINFLTGDLSFICVVSPYPWRFLEYAPYVKEKQTYSFSTSEDIDNKCDYAIVDTLLDAKKIENIDRQLADKFIVLDSIITKKDDLGGFEMFRVKLKN
jgi:hypothetical protein